jgi:hypothetical protein
VGGKVQEGAQVLRQAFIWVSLCTGCLWEWITALTHGSCCNSNTYTVLNALAGHFNSFGPSAPIPKKRLDRIVKVGAGLLLAVTTGDA